MRITISYPNDYNSEADEAAACKALGIEPGEWEAADTEEKLLDALAEAAKAGGLEYCEATDYGAAWQGTREQIEAALAAMPTWAYLSPADVDLPDAPEIERMIAEWKGA